MPLEMLLLDELEKAVCHCFCCLLAQRHIVDICLVAIIVLFQSLCRFSAVLCGGAHGSGLIMCQFIIALVVFGVLCCLFIVALVVFGVLCILTSAYGCVAWL